ncbi:RAVR2 protein, partial [Rhadina sibilatrix]|nr:RAVR2 protein [Rhadina sibilatrix]
QSSILGSTSSLLLQSPAHLPLPQQQLLKMENMQANSKPGLLGEPPTMLLQTVLGIGVMPAVSSGLAARGEALKSAAAAGMGMLPFFPNQHIVGQALPGPNAAADKGEAVPGAQPFPAGLPSLPGALRAAHSKPAGQLRNCDSSLGVRSL